MKCRGIQFAAGVQRERPQQYGHALTWGSKQLSLAYSAQYAQYNGEHVLASFANGKVTLSVSLWATFHVGKTHMFCGVAT